MIIKQAEGRGRGGKKTRYDKEIVDNRDRNEYIAGFVRKLVDRDEVPLLVFCRYKRHGANMVEMLATLGMEAPLITSDISKKNRENFAEQMRNGELNIAVSTDVWSTGINIPCLRSVVLAGEGKAPIGLKQRSGRATRLDEDKEDYTIYDIRTKGYEEQGVERASHLAEAGFNVDLRKRKEAPVERADENSDSDSEVLWLEELLNPRGRSREEQGQDRDLFDFDMAACGNGDGLDHFFAELPVKSMTCYIPIFLLAGTLLLIVKMLITAL